MKRDEMAWKFAGLGVIAMAAALAIPAHAQTPEVEVEAAAVFLCEFLDHSSRAVARHGKSSGGRETDLRQGTRQRHHHWVRRRKESGSSARR